MRATVIKPFVWLVLFVLVTGLACSSGGEATTPTQQPATPAETVEPAAPTETAESVDEGLVTNLQEVKSAIIQIESQGTFIDPEFGLVMNGAGRGSGFIIDPKGIAVTNNHVVTGAALLKVWVGGESEARNARVVAVSECSDLAVIDIDGDGYNYLEWYDGAIEVGMDVYVAGFPLGDPEYTLTRGVISKAKAGGESSWASVDSVIEYDATTNPGNSGGPVITPDGKVVGIHYAGNADTRQAYGISRQIAEGVVEELRTGENIDTMGINGQAVSTEDGSLTGIWVSSVQSGSPADQAGVQPGDIVTTIENLVLATDGTMADYCDVLRSHDPSDALGIEVLRWSSGELLDGQLNGRELEVVTTLDDGTGEDASSSGSAVGNPGASVSGDYFMSTEFDDTENWYTFAVPDTDDYTANVDNSTLYLQLDETNTTVYALYDMDLESGDVRIDSAVETVSGPNRNNISLVCRATDEGWYEFSMNSGGYWYIWKYENSSYELLNQGASYVINLQRAKNELTATCIGTDLTLYVNGSKIGSTTDNRFKNGGQVGVSVSTFDIPGAGVEFDWFAATVP